MMRYLIFAALPVLAASQQRYTAERAIDHGVAVVRLADTERGLAVSIAPSAGNRAYELKVHGRNLLYFPASDIAAFQKNPRPGLNGIPFLAPWANRLSGAGFWANGHRYPFNGGLGTVRVDANNIAIHGMLSNSPLWEVTEIKADAKGAQMTSRLSFWKYPDLVANWPFAQAYEMTYRLADGTLEVRTTVKNLSTESMPVAIGFHPYFQIPDATRSDLSVHVAARKRVETDTHLVATGQLTPSSLPDHVSLKDHTFDDGFTDLVRDSAGRATFSVHAAGRSIEVIYGPKYTVAVVFSPPGQNFICFEPMTAITNGLNLAHEGKYSGLQAIAPGAIWQESFYVRPNGF